MQYAMHTLLVCTLAAAGKLAHIVHFTFYYKFIIEPYQRHKNSIITV